MYASKKKSNNYCVALCSFFAVFLVHLKLEIKKKVIIYVGKEKINVLHSNFSANLLQKFGPFSRKSWQPIFFSKF